MVIVWAVPAGVKAARSLTPSLRDIAPPLPSLAAPLKPLSPITDWVKASDYPAGAMAGTREYAVSFELDVAATGRASACRITAGSGSAVVDRVTCDAAQRRARFTPARDAKGEPVAGRYGARLSFGLSSPRRAPSPPCRCRSRSPPTGSRPTQRLLRLPSFQRVTAPPSPISLDKFQPETRR